MGRGRGRGASAVISISYGVFGCWMELIPHGEREAGRSEIDRDEIGGHEALEGETAVEFS